MAITESGSDADDPTGVDGENAGREGEIALREPAPLPVPVSHSTNRGSAGPVRATAGVVAVAVSAAVEASFWGLHTALGVTSVVVRGSMAGQPPRAILSEAGAQVRHSVRQALGVTAPEALEESAEPSPTSVLRARGAELLRRSADFHADEVDHHHTAYSRILGEITPDEARIVRHLYLDGPQPAVEVRTGRTSYRGTFNLLGEDAALRYPNQIGEYLANLDRVGLIHITREALGNPNRYQLLEALPEVRRLLKRASFGTKVLHRTIELSSFGAGFVRTCLPVPSLDLEQHG
ncbi:Abi-alpha family protein [Nocardia sp. CDC153]|uniref:Abi-alpha family protein n=1 Tax=Nocardia sp. CDC153 TaxID=3112167 RepID=UPI002DBBCE98|nr:Abi-alpha family protein [Nocardia sp. CDC153]MEC3951876.1 Abi-alpha family protein [Nocardia sp. CDC153]